MADGDVEPLQPGMLVSHFTIDELVGGGAMGEVWKGTDRRDGTRVAVKVMAPQLNKDPLFRQRFEREAHLATLLKSPYTVQTLAFGREHGHYFIVMEFVQGDSVEKRLEQGPLEPDEALEIASDVARALEAAASQKIVHRDLKPSNIIVSPDGAAKLVDFGIAGQSSVRDQGGSFIGTVQYAAPEQQQGNVDARTDIYALGSTLFHMLSGRPPYTGRSNDQILAQHMHSPFPAALLSLSPEPVVDIVRRCMQKDPDDRYQNPAELAAALDRVRTRLMQQRTLVPPAVPDQYRTLVPEPEDPAIGGGTLIVPPPGASARGASPLGDAAPTDRTVIFPAPSSPAPASPAPAVTPSSATVVNPPPVVAPLAPPAPPKAPAVSETAVAPAPQPAAVPVLVPVQQAPKVLAPVPQEAPERSAAGGGRGKLLLIALGALIALGVAGGAVVMLTGGGGGDKKADPSATTTPAASSTIGGAGSSTSSPSASASPSGSPGASPSPTDTGTAAATSTGTATTVPTAAPTPTSGGGNTPIPSTPTPVPQATPTPIPQPTPTPVPQTPRYSFGGFQGSGCGQRTAIVSYANVTTVTTVSSSWSGPTAFSGASTQVGGSLTDGQLFFNTPAALSPGNYTFTALANGVAVASGSFTATC